MDRHTRRHSEYGFSLVEILVVIALFSTVAAMAVLSASTLGPAMQANSAMNQAVAQLRSAHDQAIAQRRNIQVEFLGNNQIRLTRADLPSGTTVLGTVTLSSTVQFALFPSLPDTPDNFGATSAVSFGGTPTMNFLSDGSFVDATGQPLNGTVFMGILGKSSTARAVTILGATGRVHPYTWNGSNWAD